MTNFSGSGGSTAAASTPPQRIVGLDWLRGAAAVLVVTLHASMAYMPYPLPGLRWATFDSSSSEVAGAIGWGIDIFIMPLFFLMSGFHAAGLFRRHGGGPFLAHRTRTVLAPLALGCVLILPLSLYTWLYGWMLDGLIPPRSLRSLKFPDQMGDGLWGPSHLWYLQFLYVYCLAAWGLGRVGARWPGLADDQRRGVGAVRWTAAMWSVPLVAAVPSALLLAWEPQILIGFRHSWWPLPANLAFFALPFGIGWWLTGGERLRLAQRHAESWLTASAAGLFLTIPLIRTHVSWGADAGPIWPLAAAFSLTGWLAALGLFTVCSKRLTRPHPLALRLAAASFWIYLFHHPLVGLAQIHLKLVPLPGLVKCALVTVLAVGVCLATDALFVRRTWVGTVLYGRGGKTAPAPRPTTAETENQQQRAA